MPGLDSATEPVEPAAGMNSGRNDPASSRSASRLAIAGWVLFDWACQPFFTLVITFVYAPYFASAVERARDWENSKSSPRKAIDQPLRTH